MVDDDDVFDAEPVEAEVPMSAWSDAEFFRAVALATHEADLEDDDGPARGPHYDW